MTDDTPRFTWEAVRDAVSYELWVSSLTAPNGPVINVNVSDTYFEPTEALGIGTYRVWVRAQSEGGLYSDWSHSVDFRMAKEGELTSAGGSLNSSRPTFSWNSIAGADRYELWVNNDSTSTARVIHETTLTDTSFTPSADLPLGNYRIWVRAIDASGTPSLWSSAQRFSIAASPEVPQTPTSTFDSTPTITWQPVAGAISYP